MLRVFFFYKTDHCAPHVTSLKNDSLTDDDTISGWNGCQDTSRTQERCPTRFRAIFPVRASYTENERKKLSCFTSYTI